VLVGGRVVSIQGIVAMLKGNGIHTPDTTRRVIEELKAKGYAVKSNEGYGGTGRLIVGGDK
jgi:hypothetical protein